MAELTKNFDVVLKKVGAGGATGEETVWILT